MCHPYLFPESMNLLVRQQRVSRPCQHDPAAVAPRRALVVVHFLHDLLQRHILQKETIASSQHVQELVAADRYESMLQRAEQCTFQPPSGQLLGRAGRRATLEDGERLLEWCIQERPDDLQARVLLLRNVLIQGLGREREVPALAVKALEESSVMGCEFMSGCYFQVLQIALLGLKAVYKLAAEGSAIPKDHRYPSYTAASFLQAAQQAVPGMAYDLKTLAERLQLQMRSCTAEEKKQLLNDKGYLSCVDLQFVSGHHHALAGEKGDMHHVLTYRPSEL